MNINIYKAINEEIREREISLVSRQICSLVTYIQNGDYKKEWVAAQADMLYSMACPLDWETEEQHDEVRKMKHQIIELAKVYGDYDII